MKQDSKQQNVQESADDQKMFKDLVESALDPLCMLQDQVLTYVNPALCALMESKAETLLGNPFTDYLAPEKQQRTRNLYQRMTSRVAFPQRYETVLLSKSGKRIDVLVFTNMANLGGKRSIIVMLHDITQLNKARRVQLENERIEAVRTMARGIGSNFTNILSVISSYAASIADSFLPRTRPHEAARKILEASRHAGELTKRLLGVTRVSGGEDADTANPIPVRPVVESACEMILPKLRDQGVKLDVQDNGDMLYGIADPGQLLDVLFNILLNGTEAMGDGGTLEVFVEGNTVSDDDQKLEKFVQITVADSGAGMTADQLEKVFLPFFTTKKERNALGLGLPVAQSMAKAWGGRIEIDSQPDLGTRVMILIPWSEAPSHLQNEVACPVKGKVLLVDDCDQDRRMMRTVLKECGHSVIVAETGKRAMELFIKQSDEIDLVVLDWIMPDVDGKDVLKFIHHHTPECRILMVSGFSRDYVRSQVRMGAWRFLQKPFSEEEFKEIVSKALTHVERS